MFEHHIEELISNIIVTYFYYLRNIQILYSVCNKPNKKHIGFKSIIKILLLI
jgi:hypothetical protein